MKVLFVCAGNICRSPMAEALFRHHAAFHASLREVEVASAGIIALDGNAPLDATVGVLRSEAGLDASRHRARRLRTTEEADLVLTLDNWVQSRAESFGLKGRVELIGDYAGFKGEEIDDPYGGPLEGYVEAVHRIERLVKAAVARLARERNAFDLPAYVARIGFGGTPRPDLKTLRAIHRAHLAAIPFENLDIQLGRPISLDLPALHAKMIERRRGGYCFEQNTLLRHALEEIGFDVIACEARVRTDSGRITARTHMVLVVGVRNERWLCDVGFGGDGPLEPVAFGGGAQEQSLWSYRLVEEGGRHVLQVQRGNGWTDLYAFVPRPRYPVDFEMANWFTSTWPDSRFVLTLTAQRSTAEARHVLRNLTLSTVDAQGVRERQVPRGELVPLLRDTFLLDVPDDVRFRAIDGRD